MSIKIMSNVWETSQSTGPQLLVELALADFADDDGKCWPAVQTLARKARSSESTVHNVLRRLQRERRIKIQDQASEYGTNIFVWLHDGRFDKAPTHRGAPDAPPPPGTPGGVHDEPPGGVHGGGVHRAPDPPLIRNREAPSEPSFDRAVPSNRSAREGTVVLDHVAGARESIARAASGSLKGDQGDRLTIFAQTFVKQLGVSDPSSLDLELAEERDMVVIAVGSEATLLALKEESVAIHRVALSVGYSGVDLGLRSA